MGQTDPFLQASQAASDIDKNVDPWDDPLGLGYAGTSPPVSFSGAAVAFTASRGNFHRFISGATVISLRCRVGISSGNWDLAVYGNSGNGDQARPLNRRWSLGGVPVPSAGAVTVAVTPTIVVKARRDWLATVCDNATATFICWNAPVQFAPLDGWQYFKAAQYPLPDPAPSLATTDSGISHHMLLMGRSS